MARPFRITAAGSRFRQKGPVAGALVHAGGPGALAARPAPAHEAVALAAHTHPPAGARRVQAVHCKEDPKWPTLGVNAWVLLTFRGGWTREDSSCRASSNAFVSGPPVVRPNRRCHTEIVPGVKIVPPM